MWYVICAYSPINALGSLTPEVSRMRLTIPSQKEMWTETPVHNGKKGRPVNKDRFISKM